MSETCYTIYCKMNFTKEKLLVLSKLFIDIAKALLIACFASPFINSNTMILISIRFFCIALLFIYESLELLDRKDNFL